MASLPEDDGPTMVGAAGAQRAAGRLPTGHDGHDPGSVSGDDTTSAQLGPPAAPPAAAASAPHLASDDLEDDDDEPVDERTVQQSVGPELAAAAIAAAAPLPAAGTPAVRPKAPSTTSTDASDDDEPAEDSMTATAPRISAASLIEAAQSGRGVPISIPGRVEIRTLEEDESTDETEVRTRPGQSGLEVPLRLRGSAALPAPRPAAGRPPEVEPEPALDHGADDDGVTTQAQAPRMGSAPDLGPPATAKAVAAVEIADEPATRPGVADESDELLTRPGLGEAEPATRPGVEGAGEPPTRPGVVDPKTAKVERESDGYANDEDDDESVTTRAPMAEPYGEDSVTTQAPNLPLELIQAAIEAATAGPKIGLDDTSAATTQNVKAPRRSGGGSPADEEPESVTTQAPGHVTNMLRVIASGSSPELATTVPAPLEDEDDGPENRTAVMANAPIKRVIQDRDSARGRLPAIRPTGGPLTHGPMGAAAPRLEPTSESGLRVARAGSSSNERASLGQLVGTGDARTSMPMPAGGPHGDGADLGALPMQSLHDVDFNKGPSYGLLVAIVAAVSVIVPVVLFVVLRYGGETAEPASPAEPASELERFGAPPRAKAPRGKNGLTVVPSASVAPPPSAAPSSSASSKPGSRSFPFRR